MDLLFWELEAAQYGDYFQQGLDSYYEGWSDDTVIAYRAVLAQTYGVYSMDAFDAGRKQAELDDTI